MILELVPLAFEMDDCMSATDWFDYLIHGKSKNVEALHDFRYTEYTNYRTAWDALEAFADEQIGPEELLPDDVLADFLISFGKVEEAAEWGWSDDIAVYVEEQEIYSHPDNHGFGTVADHINALDATRREYGEGPEWLCGTNYVAEHEDFLDLKRTENDARF